MIHTLITNEAVGLKNKIKKRPLSYTKRRSKARKTIMQRYQTQAKFYYNQNRAKQKNKLQKCDVKLRSN